MYDSVAAGSRHRLFSRHVRSRAAPGTVLHRRSHNCKQLLSEDFKALVFFLEKIIITARSIQLCPNNLWKSYSFSLLTQALSNESRIVDCMLILDACENMALRPSFRACTVALSCALQMPHVDMVRRLVIDLRSRGSGGLDQVGEKEMSEEIGPE